ncbi:MAG: hypothetical protein ACXVCX_21595 [Ktedonobacterales bacterium]
MSDDAEELAQACEREFQAGRTYQAAVDADAPCAAEQKRAADEHLWAIERYIEASDEFQRFKPTFFFGHRTGAEALAFDTALREALANCEAAKAMERAAVDALQRANQGRAATFAAFMAAYEAFRDAKLKVIELREPRVP